MFEQVTDYKSACKVLGIKPIDKRRKLEEHVLLYIQLCTITQSVLIYDSLVEMPQNMQLKPLNHYI